MRWYWASSGRLTESGNPTRELGNTAYFIQKHLLYKEHKYLFWNGGEAAPFINFYLDYDIDTPQQQKTEDKDKTNINNHSRHRNNKPRAKRSDGAKKSSILNFPTGTTTHTR